jgi:xanthine phosphoribosyltransferase
MDNIIISWERFDDDCRILADLIKKSTSNFKSIVAIGRGGLIVAARLAYLLNICRIETICISSYDSHNKKSKIKTLSRNLADLKLGNCLLVDDLVDTGSTLEYLVKINKSKIDTAVLYVKDLDKKTFDPTYHVKKVSNKWVEFPWERL